MQMQRISVVYAIDTAHLLFQEYVEGFFIYKYCLRSFIQNQCVTLDKLKIFEFQILISTRLKFLFRRSNLNSWFS